MNDVKYDVEITVKYRRRRVLNSADGLICLFVFLFDLYHFSGQIFWGKSHIICDKEERLLT